MHGLIHSNLQTLCALFIGTVEKLVLCIFTNPCIVFECPHAHEAFYNTTFSNGSLGSRIDEERSEMR